MVTRTFNYIYKLAFVWVMALLVTGCEDNLLPDDPSLGVNLNKGEKVMLSAGTTENTVSTRADGKTYYMPADHRFVCKMYYKTNESGVLYDTLRYHTAWLKVDDGGAGNSLYWKSDYLDKAQEEDIYHNDVYAPTFYWQNRKEHAFLAWTDLNHATNLTNNSGLNYNNHLTNYEFHTGKKESKWVEKTITVHGNAVPFASEEAVVNYYKNRTEGQTEFKEEARKETAASYYMPYYWWSDDLEDFCKVIMTTNQGVEKSETEKTSNRYLMYFFNKKLEYTDSFDPSSLQTIFIGGKEYTFVVDQDNNPIARQVIEGSETKYYQCTPYGHIMYDETLSNDNDYTVYLFRRNLKKETVEIIQDYPALAFGLTDMGHVKGDGKTMAIQPDILQALTIDQVPTSAIMEANRVHLYFKHQFAQVQVNLKNSVDNSVQITEDQIKKVELLGVTKTGYTFIDMKADGTLNVPVGFNSSTFKEVVATDFTDDQLKENPYGTTFNMFDRTLTEDDKNISKIVKSYECITFGRLQAIRITWQEKDDNGQVNGVEHVATYRVPDTNDQNQALRLLEAGKKYIWNMELRRGTLAVVRTEIIPWEENQEEYSTDGFIVTTTTSNGDTTP